MLFRSVPTTAESGLPGFNSTGWFGLLAPTGTPAEVLSKLHRDTVAVLGQTDIKARLYVQGMVPVGNSASDFAKAMDREMLYWDEVVKRRKLSAN